MDRSNDFTHIESIYWVFTQLCNDHCMCCYNESGPQRDRISTVECMAIIDNLPDSADRIILSSGEDGNDKDPLIRKENHLHNFCAVVSGAIGFLKGGDEIPNEISIRFWKIYPCCPGTKDSFGDARTEKVADVLARFAHSHIFQKLNRGDPYCMGENFGVTGEYTRKRSDELNNVCKWCYESFSVHYDIKRNCSRHTDKQKGVAWNRL